MDPWDGLRVGTGIALPATLPVPHPGYTLPHRCPSMMYNRGARDQRNSAVGLKSVDQLTLSVHFSGFQTMTEVYNLLRIGRINNHLSITGNE